MGTLTIRLDDKLERALNLLAKAQHRTESEGARELLRRHILVRQLDETRNRLRAYTEPAGYLTDKVCPSSFRNSYGRNSRVSAAGKSEAAVVIPIADTLVPLQ
ncbi:MAG: hypothetical protein ACYDE0_15570 [Acidiferrobacterales bacterium]